MSLLLSMPRPPPATIATRLPSPLVNIRHSDARVNHKRVDYVNRHYKKRRLQHHHFGTSAVLLPASLVTTHNDIRPSIPLNFSYLFTSYAHSHREQQPCLPLNRPAYPDRIGSHHPAGAVPATTGVHDAPWLLLYFESFSSAESNSVRGVEMNNWGVFDDLGGEWEKEEEAARKKFHTRLDERSMHVVRS